MTNKSTTVVNVIVILLLFFILMGIAWGNILRKESSNEISASVKSLRLNDVKTAALRRNMDKLYEAENSFRLYAATYDSVYFRKYRNDLRMVHVFIDSVAGAEKDSVNGISEKRSFDKVFRRKLALTGMITELKQITDSLLMLVLHLDSINSNSGLRNYKLKLDKKIVADTVVANQPVKKRKNLFQRIRGAISGKADKDTVTVKSLMETNLDQQAVISQLEEVIRSSAGRYQQQLLQQLAVKKALNKKEKELVLLNITLIGRLNGLLNAFEKQEQEELEASRNRTVSLIGQRSHDLSQIVLWSFIIIILLMLLILYNIRNVQLHARKLVAARMQAEEQVKLKADFMANVSHEIRNPLTAIIGFTEQLSYVDLPDAQQQHLSSVKAAADMLLSTVNDILDFSKLQASKMQLQSDTFDPRKVVAEVVAMMKPLAERKGLELLQETTELKADLLVAGDSFRLKQVLVNLVSNAIKFTRNGSVVIKAGSLPAGKASGSKPPTAEKKIMLRFEVRDTGIGIPKDKVGDIFNEFVQVGQRSNQPIGTGLGLAICKKIVGLHGGTIKAASEPGKGSAFFVEIPYAPATASIERSVQSARNKEQEGMSVRGKKILLIDDNPLILQLGSMLLQKHEIIVTTAEDGKAALELYLHNNYDMVITDLNLPHLSGKDLTIHIRNLADPAKANVPVLALTGYVFENEADEYLAAGFNNYIIKPFNESDILAELSKYF